MSVRNIQRRAVIWTLAYLNQETAMKSKRLLESSSHPFWRRHRVQGAGAVVLCILLCFLLIPSHAAAGKLEDHNKAVARAAFFDYLKFESSSDLTFTESWMIAEGDKVAVCFTAKGTHDGVFQGVSATGKHYELSAMTVWRFVGGKIAGEWVFSNDLDLYRQLGLFKEPGSTDH
jgi:predicted ester cyclase